MVVFFKCKYIFNVNKKRNWVVYGSEWYMNWNKGGVIKCGIEVNGSFINLLVVYMVKGL